MGELPLMRHACNTCGRISDRRWCPAHRLTQPDRQAAGLTGARGSTRQWRKLRGQVLERDGHCCQRCGDDKELEVHHMDGDPANDAMPNLLTLCAPCHRQTEREPATAEAIA